jgi:hypothetical protein
VEITATGRTYKILFRMGLESASITICIAPKEKAAGRRTGVVSTSAGSFKAINK